MSAVVSTYCSHELLKVGLPFSSLNIAVSVQYALGDEVFSCAVIVFVVRY